MYKFADLFEIIDGDRGKNYPSDSDFSDDGYCLFLNAGNVTKNGWSFEKNSFITEEKDSILRKGRVERGSLVLTTRGTVGNVALYDDSVPYEHIRINSGMVILKSKIPNELYDHFAYYLLISPYIKKKIELFCSGSAQPQLPIKDFIKIKVGLPEIDKQHDIVKIISEYDQAIENNNKRIKILEQMIENLYKEWFVRFRFPGHERAEFEKGFPRWELVKLADLVSVKAGGDRPSLCVDEYSEECPIPVYSNGIDKEGLYGYTDKPIIKAKSITISARGTIGYVCLRREPFVPIVRLLSLTPIDDRTSAEYLYYLVKFDGMIGNGTSQQQITIPMVQRKRVMLPPRVTVKSFTDNAKKIWDEVDVLKRKNNNLALQRDLLLPRLMSGKLEVK